MSFKVNESLSEQIAKHLGDRIISGELQPGDRLQEMRVAKDLEVSRGSVREAFLLLESRFLLEIVPRKGAVVSPLTPELVYELYEALTVTVQTILTKVIKSWEEGDLDVFHQLKKRMTEHMQANDVEAIVIDVSDFIQASYSFLNNTFLENILRVILPAAERTFMIAAAAAAESDDFSAIISYFTDMVDCMEKRDVQASHDLVAGFLIEQSHIIAKRIQT